MRIRTNVLGLMVLITATSAALAGECGLGDFNGTYAFQGHGTEVRNATGSSPIALSGTLEADGRGGFVFWANTVAFVPPQPGAGKTVITGDLLQAARAAGSELRYEVAKNCRIRIHGVVQTPFGPSPLEIVGGLADGGRTALMQLGSPIAIGAWTAVRVGP